MAKPKKDKYIRDLFEEDFYIKFSEYLCSINILNLFKNFYDSRIKVKNLLLSDKHFHDVPISAFCIVEDDEVFTIQKFNKVLYDIEYRELFYFVCDFIKKYKIVKNKISLIGRVEDTVRKILNKSIDKYLDKNQNNFVLFKPSRSSIITNVLSEILITISTVALKEIKPKYKSEITIDDIEKRNTFITYEYEQITNIIEIHKIMEKDLIKSKKQYENMTFEDCLKYNISQLSGFDILDERIDFVIKTFKDKKYNKKDLAFEYLREKYNVSPNNDTLDKILDRGRNKREDRDINKILFKKIDNDLCMANAQDKLNNKSLLNWIVLFDCDMKNLAHKLKISS